MEKLAKIYCLIDPITKKERYVGQTKCSLRSRLSGHISEAFLKPGIYNTDPTLKYVYNNQKEIWIRELKAKGLKPIILLLAEVREEDKYFWEWFYIHLYNRNDLLNQEIIRYDESQKQWQEQKALQLR